MAVVGYLDRTDDPAHPKGGHPQNVAAVLHQGQVVTTYAKHHLPNYGVFDEYRYFKPGNSSGAADPRSGRRRRDL